MNPLLHRIGRTLLIAGTATTLFAAGCSRGSNTYDSAKLAGEATFDPRPTDQDTIAAQLKRYPGQTKFLTPVSDRFWASRDAAAANGAGGDRGIQESDVFKIGNPGDKLLFLLNNYRGLQVISFESGADDPKIVGRVEATGNWPTDMYFDAAHDRLIVLENNYSDNDGNYYDYSELQSRLVVYDVSDAAKPRIATTIDLQGTLADSRMVGDVLYVATSVRPAWNADNQDGKGYVQSFSLKADGVSAVETLTLSAPVGYGETMNIVETGAEGAKEYYLVAILSQSSWSWWDRQSLVEVVDISDAAGDIKPLMQVTTRGVVRERSQTHIKDGTLVVASNYVVDDTNNIQRIAVETFTFPQAGQLITKNEAEYRRLHIERAEATRRAELVADGLSGDALTDALEAYRLELQKDAELGLYGRFVSSGEDRSPVKLLADHAVTIGNTQGLSANIQDVRVSGDLLYVFWVPANNIDPLDVFDISAPQTRLTHLAHLEFDGWIQRAMPVSYGGKNYILGLGWIVPSVDNDNNRRYPQVALFEVKKDEQTQRFSATQVAQQNLGSSNSWANFNGADKDIEFRFDSDAAGVIMYTFYGWAEAGYTQGGKLIGFDLSQAAANPDAVFTEGGILSGGEGWLRRVFTNPEIARVNTFADTALGVYNVDGIGAADRTIAATKVLELARNLRGYATLTAGANVQGVQIVSDYGWSYDDATTELRLVDANRADAEATDVTLKLTLPGYFVDQTVDTHGHMVILTNATKRTVVGDDVSYTDEMTLSIVALNDAGNGFDVAHSTVWSIDAASETPFQYDRRLITLNDGRIIAIGAGLKLVNADSISTLTLNGCSFDANKYVTLTSHNGRLVASYAESLTDPEDSRLNYERHFAVPASVTETEFVCGAAVNVPGKPVLVRDGHMVTQDTRLLEVLNRGEGDDAYPEVVTEEAVASLALATDGLTATLIDLYDPKNVAASSMHLLGDDRLVFVESNAKSLRFGWFDDVRGSWPRSGTQQNMDHRFVYLGFDDELRFTKTSYTLGEGRNSAPQVNAVLPALTAGEEAAAVVTQGNKLQLLSLSGMERPTAKSLAKVAADFTVDEPATSVKLTGYARYWLSEDELNVTKVGDRTTLEIADGLFGVTQIVIAQ